MPFIKTRDGTEIFYKDWGSGQSLVFHHGWPLSVPVTRERDRGMITPNERDRLPNPAVRLMEARATNTLEQ